MSKKAILILVCFFALSALIYGMVRLGWFLPTASLSSLLASGSWSRWLPWLVVVSALVDSLNPCAFSVLLLTIAFLFSLGHNRRKIVTAGLWYIGGIFVVYYLIGIGLVQALTALGAPHLMAKVGATIVILWAIIDLLGEYVPNFPIQLKIPQAAHLKMATLIEKGTLPAAFALGVLVGLSEFPCTGGPYLFILGLLHDQTTHWSGAIYLFFYNLIFVAPLLVILIVGSDRNLLTKVEAWKKTNNRLFRTTMGLVMLALGALIFWF